VRAQCILYYEHDNFTVDSYVATIVSKVFRIIMIASAALLTACDSAPTNLRLVAPSSELDLEIAYSLAETLERGTKFRLQVSSEQRAGEVALDMLLAGEADMALVSNYLPFREGITTALPLYPSVLHIAYREGRDSSSALTLLNQANVYAGAKGSASRLMFERIVERTGLSDDDYSFIDASSDPATVIPDIAVVFAPISPQRMAEFEDFRLFSLGSPADIGSGSIVDAVALLNPPLRPFVIPATTYDAATAGPVVTVAVDKILVVRSDIAASIVYDLIGEIHRSRPALSAARPGVFDHLGDDFDVSKSTFVLHAGAQDFLQRAEPTIYERYSGVAEVFVTLVIAFVSAAFAVVRILKIRRKNRIDEFYSAAIDIRNSISAANTMEERTAAANKIRELQNTAFEQLVDEKLAADESFRIFITLSNDILDQTGNK
jgi:TRAP-type uncharacterized transport system substrate-binding protein